MTDSIPTRARIMHVDDRNDTVRIIRILADKPFEYHAGQYVRVTAHNFEPRFFSIGAAPKKNGHIDLHIRNMGQGLSAHLSEQLSIGDAIHIEGPFGNMTSASTHERPSLMIGGGTGIAPCIALAQEILRKGLSEDVITILYGIQKEEDIYCKKELDALLATGQVEITYCIGTDTPDHAVTRLNPILDHHAIYLSGPDAMIHNVYPILLSHGAQKDLIFSDAKYTKEET